jgi:hypothetical protein
MHARSLSVAAFVAFLAMGPGGAHAQATYKQLPVTNEAYVKPFPPLRIVGNLYYVGTYDPNRFVDPDGYQAKLQFYEKLVRANLGKDQ